LKTDILGVSFDNVSPEEALAKAVGFLENDGADMIFTPNPEMVMLARRDAEFMEILNSASLLIPDGIGIVYASRLTKSKISRRVPGIDLLIDLFGAIQNTDKTLFFLGGAPGVAEAAADKVREGFPGLSVVEARHGYFRDEDDEDVIAAINAVKPDIVLVGLGFPRQEKWIYRYRDKLDTRLLIGVGGSLDVLSGKLRRAPKFFQKLGLEWLYRLLRQPKRIWRQRVLVKFAMVVLYKKMRGEL